MQVKIEKLTSKQIETKFGVKNKLSIFSGGKYINSFANAETAKWKEGDTVEIPELEERHYIDKSGKDRTSYDVKWPKKDNFGVDSRMINDKLDKILNILENKKCCSDETPIPEEMPLFDEESAPF